MSKEGRIITQGLHRAVPVARETAKPQVIGEAADYKIIDQAISGVSALDPERIGLIGWLEHRAWEVGDADAKEMFAPRTDDKRQKPEVEKPDPRDPRWLEFKEYESDPNAWMDTHNKTMESIRGSIPRLRAEPDPDLQEDFDDAMRAYLRHKGAAARHVIPRFRRRITHNQAKPTQSDSIGLSPLEQATHTKTDLNAETMSAEISLPPQQDPYVISVNVNYDDPVTAAWKARLNREADRALVNIPAEISQKDQVSQYEGRKALREKIPDSRDISDSAYETIVPTEDEINTHRLFTEPANVPVSETTANVDPSHPLADRLKRINSRMQARERRSLITPKP